MAGYRIFGTRADGTEWLIGTRGTVAEVMEICELYAEQSPWVRFFDTLSDENSSPAYL